MWSSPPERGREPLVSVVVCVYNGERYLRETLASVLNGVYTNFELIVVDDGSADGTPAVLAGLSDPRLRVIRQENQGASAALAAGIRLAQGEYIALLDQDDRWHPEFLAALIARLEADSDLDLAFSWFQVINEEGRPMGLTSRRRRGNFGFSDLLADFVIGASSNVVMRRRALLAAGEPDRGLRRYYDLDLVLRVALLRPENVAAAPRELMFYRRRPGQTSSDFRGMCEEWETVLAQFRERAPEAVQAVEALARSNMTRYFACLAYEARAYGEGLRLLRRAFRASPAAFLSDRRNWIAGAACLAGLLLPARLHQWLERLAGLHR